MELTNLSSQYMTETPIVKRKSLGQYMTPPQVSQIMFDKLGIFDGAKVLDPAVGTGELLLGASRNAKELELYGWDVDPEILQVAKKQVKQAKFREHSVFDTNEDIWLEYFDFIIANPPYFELKSSDFDGSKFEVTGGRTNIYSLFFEKYFPLLKTGGRMGFIVPPSMNAGAYFANLRKWILHNGNISFLKVVRDNSHFTDALTSVQIIIIEKTSPKKDNKYVIDFAKMTGNIEAPVIFTDNKKLIQQMWDGKKSLYDYGYEAVTGTITWNSYKTQLSSQPVGHILYYAKDISASNEIILSNNVSSKRYLSCEKAPLVGECLLVNRIVGSLDNPRLKIAKIEGKTPYYVENHINLIRPRTGVQQSLTLDEVFARMTTINGLESYLRALTGNTQLSAKELMFLLPL